ncbi:MAG: glycosyltransferase family 2 protein [Pelotomaculum sp.]|nr:glycosyltransferase family 2 protein [Pelotomaculum sp.]
MASNLKISVIIPTYNEAATIGRTTGHLKNRGDVHEIIVVDGGSTDGTPALAGKGVQLLRAPRGRASQMNAGARAAAGDVLLFLHSDTSLPDDFSRQIELALSDRQVAGGAFRVKFDQPGLFFALTALGSNLRAALTGIYFGDQAIFARRRAFFEAGGYPPIDLMEDWEFSRRLRQVGKTVLLPGPVTTSARRWLIYGRWRTTWLMHKIKILYILGVSPSRLKSMYTDRRR